MTQGKKERKGWSVGGGRGRERGRGAHCFRAWTLHGQLEESHNSREKNQDEKLWVPCFL